MNQKSVQATQGAGGSDPVRRVLAPGLLLIALAMVGGPSLAQDAGAAGAEEVHGGWQVDRWFLFTSLYTKHFDPEPYHNNDQNLLGLEVWTRNQWLFGFSAFDNSFDQSSQYLYAGYRWGLFGSQHGYFKLTGGLLHGYEEPYEDKIPMNGLGVAPAVTTALGFRYRFLVAEVTLAGFAAVIVTAGFAF